MTDPTKEPVGSPQEGEPTGPVIRDKRRLDPETGQVRERATAEGNSTMTDEQSTQHDAAGSDGAFAGDVGDQLPGDGKPADAASTADASASGAPTADPSTSGASSAGAETPADTGTNAVPAGAEHPDTKLAADRLADLQRLQAEYVNYKRRVDRDREAARSRALESFVESLLPVLDEIHLAREHGDLGEDTPFAKIATKLDTILARYGLESFGESGDAFDPTFHEALMHIEAEVPEGSEGTTVVQVMQPGYKVGERVVRPARVAVADPQ